MGRVSDSAAAIEVHELVREFRKGPRAVDGIDLAVQTGEIYGFLGPNGAGKSTTVLMLTTLLPPTSGHATVGGYDIVREGAQVRAAIGAALQEAALDAILTGREHLTLQATLQGIPAKQRKVRAQALLERVGLAEAADRGAWTSPWRSCTSRGSCFSTSRPPGLIPRAARRCGMRSRGSRTTRA